MSVDVAVVTAPDADWIWKEVLFILEFALAGFDKEEVSIIVENNQLKVSGQRSEVEEDESVTYLHKGIAARKFSTVFNLPDYMEVESALFSNGILEVTLEKHIPEEKKPKTIEIAIENFFAAKLTFELFLFFVFSKYQGDQTLLPTSAKSIPMTDILKQTL